MKRILEGKIYDTEKATIVATHMTDDKQFPGEESLYRTVKGNWFRVVLYPDGSLYSTIVEAFTLQEAERWMEKAIKTDEIVENFSKYIEEA